MKLYFEKVIHFETSNHSDKWLGFYLLYHAFNLPLHPWLVLICTVNFQRCHMNNYHERLVGISVHIFLKVRMVYQRRKKAQGWAIDHYNIEQWKSCSELFLSSLCREKQEINAILIFWTNMVFTSRFFHE